MFMHLPYTGGSFVYAHDFPLTVDSVGNVAFIRINTDDFLTSTGFWAIRGSQYPDQFYLLGTRMNLY
jgi:hypothetical protein